MRRPFRSRFPKPTFAGLLVGLVALAASSAGAAGDAFSVQRIPSTGRTVTAALADLDGDGRQDLLQAVTFDMPPDERRVVRVYPQDSEGRIPDTPALEFAIAPRSAAYDIADVAGGPGSELLMLRPRGIEVISFARGQSGALEVRRNEARIPDDLTIGVSNDERGLDRLAMANFDFPSGPVLIAPGLGETFFLSPDGALRARIESGSRANYFLEPTGLMLSESDIQIFLDAPRISIGDCNGDGRIDILASKRHEMLLFHGRSDGSFPRKPSRRIKLSRVTIEDHIRGTGAVRTAAKDIDGDGLADLIISETGGGVMDASSDTYIHFNRGSGWDLDKPDFAFESKSTLGADQLIDVDGDGKLELLRVGIPINVLELIEIFLTEAIDAKLSVYPLERAAEAPAAPAKPDSWFKIKLGIPLDFDTSRPAGFIPTVRHDFNGDGFRDYITSNDGTRLEVYVGSRKGGYRKRSARQKVSTEGQLGVGDLNGDGLTDLLIFNSRRVDEPLYLLTNRGTLPGTKPRISAQ
jgi:hypothetical protein